jgi:hypothetical protein
MKSVPVPLTRPPHSPARGWTTGAELGKDLPTMITLWLLGLLAVGGLYYGINRQVRNSKTKKSAGKTMKERSAREAEQDRLDCLAAESELAAGPAADRATVGVKSASAPRR